MPTPHLSRAPSGPSPKYATGDELCDTTCPIDWDTNVVNFISTCLHPGLVRRTSSSAVGHGFDKPYHFRRQHRRNFSTATAAGYTKYPDIQNASSRLPYSNAFNHSNDYQVAPTYYKRVLGHTRNISDPTSGWDFRVVNKPLTLDQLTERPSFNWDGFDGQHPVVSSENQHTLPDASAIHEIKAENYPCLKPSPPSNDVIESSLMCTGDMEISQTRNSECDVDDNTGACLSPCFRSCANPCVVLVGLCLTMFMQTMVVSGLMSSMFTTLEKRFNLTSRQIGYMISCYEIAGVVTTVVVSFINGQKHNRLRVIGLATLILALGFGLFALPHFLAGPYRPSLFSYDTTAVENDSLLHSSHAPPYHLHSNQDPTDQMTGPICIHQTHNTVASHEVIQTSFADETNVDASVIRAVSLTTTNHVNNINSNSTNGLSNMESIISNDIVTSVLFPTFCIAMLLAGIGASPLYVLAPTYLWDNLTDRQYPIYAALFYSAGGLGPACGFLAGAGFLSIYIDSPFMLPQSGVDRNSPLWLGAWWLGMLVCAALTFMVALPVICFPKRLTVKKNVSVTQLGGYGDVDETSPSTAQCANHNIYNDNNTTEPSNNSNINLSYIKSPNGLPDTSEQIQKTTKMTATTTCVTTPSTCQGQPACRTTVKYPSLDEFKQQQQRQPPPLQQPSTVVQDSIGFHNTITTSTVNTTTPFPTDTLINVGTNVAIPSNHYYLHSKDYYNDVAKGDGCVAATMEQLNDINNDNGDLRMSAKKSLRNSFHKSRTKLRKKIKALILILRRVLTNPVWLGVTLSTVVEQSIVAAFLTFAAKYIQILFHVPAYLASIHTGAVIVPSSLLGVLSGALLMRHFRPTLHRTLFGLCIMIAITVVTSISLMSIGCHSSRMAGITATYDGKRWPWRSGPGFLIPPNMTAPCNRFCYSFDNRINIQYTQFPESDCSIRHYNPVCWTAVKKTENNNIKCNHIDDDNDDSLTDCNSNSLTFFNPCFAGCRTRVQDGGVVKKYSDCQCVTPYALNPSGPLNSSSSIAYANISGHHDLFNSSGEVYPGRCKPECSLYGLFLAMLFLHILCTGILQNPSNVITLSCVSSEDGSVALGLQIFFVRTLAYIPAPIYFGQLFDLACQYRSNSVNHHSSPSKLTNYETSTLMNKTQPTSTSFLLLQNSLSTSAIAATTASMSSDQQPIVDNVSGGCLEYNLEGLPFIWLGAVCALKVISLIGSTITYWLAKRQFNLIAKHKEQEQQVSCKDEELIAEKTEIPFQHKVLSDPKSMLSNPSEIGIYGEIYASDNLQEIPV